MDYKKKFLEYGKKYITLADLAKLLNIEKNDAKTLYYSISELIKEGTIEAVKSSLQNGNYEYPLNKKYRILIEPAKDEEIINQVNNLHPTLRKSGYLSSHVQEYVKNKEVIDKLDHYLFYMKKGTDISRKERSFEIFGHEKVLDKSEVKVLLRNLDISDSDLGFYDTPEYCFHDYIPQRKDNLTLLICENKDIWFNIRRCMFEDHYKSLFGVSIDGVVYGNGNKVSDKKGALVEYVKFMGNPAVNFLYWGDIDREGLDIYKRTREVNETLNIELFTMGYRKMIERSRNITLEDSPSSKKEGMDFNDLFGGFSLDEQKFLNQVLKDNKLIPQEIIPYTLLSER